MTPTELFRISAKNLGALALPGFCPRCAWIDFHSEELPFQMPFPGIFSSIDAYTKHVVNGTFEKDGKLPGWLSEVGEVKGIDRISPRDFKTELNGVLLTGTPDAVLQLADSSHFVLDFKTARFTATQDALLPMYRVQLNGYSLIAEAKGLSPVSGLALVYFEPPTSESMRTMAVSHTTTDGFAMPFSPHVLRIEKNHDEVRALARKAKELSEMSRPPEGLAGCESCQSLQALLALVGNGQ